MNFILWINFCHSRIKVWWHKLVLADSRMVPHKLIIISHNQANQCFLSQLLIFKRISVPTSICKRSQIHVERAVLALYSLQIVSRLSFLSSISTLTMELISWQIILSPTRWGQLRYHNTTGRKKCNLCFIIKMQTLDKMHRIFKRMEQRIKIWGCDHGVNFLFYSRIKLCQYIEKHTYLPVLYPIQLNRKIDVTTYPPWFKIVGRCLLSDWGVFQLAEFFHKFEYFYF